MEAETKRNIGRSKEDGQMKKYRVAVAGCGAVSAVHEQILRDMPDCEIVACVDTRPERAWEMARRYGCVAYRDLGKMLKAEHPDAVHLCTPHACHAPQAVLAAEAGAAVLMEAPPAVSPEQWLLLEEAARKAPVGVCFQHRYHAEVLKAQELVRSGALGRVAGARGFVTCRIDKEAFRDDWRGSWETEGGGILLGRAVHTLDLMVAFLGRPDSVDAVMANHHLRGVTEEEDTAAICLTSGKQRGLLYVSCAGAADDPPFLEIRAEKGCLRMENGSLELRTADGTEPVDCSAYRQGKSGHRLCIEDFYHSLADGSPLRNDVPTCADTMHAVLAAYEAGRKTLAGNAVSA